MKQEKQLLLDEIKAQIEGASSFFVAKYSKLTANKANNFRREMRKIGGNFEIVRKRMFSKAAESFGMKFDLSKFEGHIGIIFASKDAIETTKAIIRFSDAHEKSFQLIAAKVEGQLLHESDVARIAALPSKDQMRAAFLGLLEAPMSQTLAAIDAVLSSVVYCLDNKANQQ